MAGIRDRFVTGDWAAAASRYSRPAGEDGEDGEVEGDEFGDFEARELM